MSRASSISESARRKCSSAKTPFDQVPKGHVCTWKMVYENKAANKLYFCEVNGAEQACPGMNAAGECLSKK